MTITKSKLLSVLKRVKMRQDATNNSIPEGREVEFVEK